MPANTEQLEILVRMRDFASRRFLSLSRTVRRTMANARRSILSVRAALTAVAVAFTAFKTLNFASSLEAVRISFDNLTKSLGGADKILGIVRANTRGTIDDFSIMRAVNNAIILGVGKSAAQFGRLATIARRLGRAVGRDTLQAFNDLTFGIGRQSRLILDNLGIVVRFEDAQKKLAAQLGKTTRELTEQEKRTAFLNAVLDGSQKAIKRLGPDIEVLADIWGRLRAQVANFGQDILAGLTPGIKVALKSLSAFIRFLRPQLAQVIEVILDFVARLPALTASALGVVRDAVIRLIDIFLNFKRAFLDIKVVLLQVSEFVSKTLFKFKDARDAAAAIKKTKRALKGIKGEFKELSKEVGQAFLGWQKPLMKASEVATRGVKDLGQSLRDAFDRRTEQNAKALFFSIVPSIATVRAWILRLWEAQKQLGLEKFRKKILSTVRDIQGSFQGPPSGPPPPRDDEERKSTQALQDNARVAAEYARTNDLITGMSDALAEMREDYRALGDVAGGALLSIRDAMVNEVSAGLSAMIDGTKTVGEAFRDMARGILQQIQRIIVEMIVFRTISGIIGVVGGIATGSMSPSTSGTLSPSVPSADVAVPVTRFGSLRSANDPLPVTRRTTSTRQVAGGGGGAVVVNQNLNFNHSFSSPLDERRLLERNKGTIVSTVIQANNQSLGARRGLS